MPQSVWKGAISFGLVSIPIRLFSATEERSVSLHQVHLADAGRIRYKRICQIDGEEVPYSDIARGYELPDGDVVVLTDEDFAELPLATSRSIEVLSFVDESEIDPVQLSRPYYCDPTGDAKPYVLLRQALERAGKVAVVKVALRQRESLATLFSRDGILVLQTMLWPDEVRQPKVSFDDDDVQLRPQELQMAESYVDALSGPIDTDEMVDRYRVALEQLVEAKAAGREVERPPEPAADTGTVVDLMEALRRSVAEAKRSRGEDGAEAAEADEAAPREAAKSSARGGTKTAAKKTATKSTGAAKKTASKSSSTRKTAAKSASAKKTAKKTAAAGSSRRSA